MKMVVFVFFHYDIIYWLRPKHICSELIMLCRVLCSECCVTWMSQAIYSKWWLPCLTWALESLYCCHLHNTCSERQFCWGRMRSWWSADWTMQHLQVSKEVIQGKIRNSLNPQKKDGQKKCITHCIWAALSNWSRDSNWSPSSTNHLLLPSGYRWPLSQSGAEWLFL